MRPASIFLIIQLSNSRLRALLLSDTCRMSALPATLYPICYNITVLFATDSGEIAAARKNERYYHELSV